MLLTSQIIIRKKEISDAYNFGNLELDKDLLGKDKLIYSPDTCAFIPSKLNNFIGGYIGKIKDNGLPVGVSKHRGLFASHCIIHDWDSGNYKTVHLGSYKTPIEAYMKFKEIKEIEYKKCANYFKPILTDREYNALYNLSVEDMNINTPNNLY